MPHRLVQQHARPARPQYHLHLARRRRHRTKLQNRSPRRLLRQVLRALRPFKLLQPGSSAPARRPLGRRRSVLGDHKHIQPAQRLRVAGKSAIRCRNQNTPQLLAVSGPHLHNARIVSPRRPVGPQNQLQPRRQVQIEPAQRNRIEICPRRLRKSLHRLLGRSRRNQRRRPCRVQQTLRAQIVGVGISGPLA